MSLPSHDKSTRVESAYGEPISSGWIGGGLVLELIQEQERNIAQILDGETKQQAPELLSALARREIIETLDVSGNRVSYSSVLGCLVLEHDLAIGEIAALAQIPVEGVMERLETLIAAGIVKRSLDDNPAVYSLNQ